MFAKKQTSLDGDTVRYKARLVVKGYTQREDIDYNEVFSYVVKPSSIRILLAHYKLAHDDLDEKIFMSQLTWLKTVRKENMMCKLKKSLYGLK